MLRGFSFLGPTLAAIGRKGELAFAISIFLGLALPQLAEAARPFLVITVFIFTMLTYARVDLANLTDTVRQPGRLALAMLWAIIGPPLMFLGIIAFVGPSTSMKR